MTAERQRTGYRASLPKALDDLLETAPRGSDKTLTPDMREAVAREALTCGITPKGPVLAYVVKRLRHSLGVGDFPTPPDLRPGETAFVDATLKAAAARLRQLDGADTEPPVEGLVVNPDGYTPVDAVLPPNVHPLRGGRPRAAAGDSAA